jgi:hypothetical protein
MIIQFLRSLQHVRETCLSKSSAFAFTLVMVDHMRGSVCLGRGSFLHPASRMLERFAHLPHRDLTILLPNKLEVR